MSDAPQTRVQSVLPFRVMVESGPETGEWVDDPRLSVVTVRKGCDDEFSRATLSFWPFRMRTLEDPQEILSPADVLNGGERQGFEKFWSPDQQFMIVRNNSEGADEPFTMVLRGFVDRVSFQEITKVEGSQSSYEFTLESMAKRASERERGQIVGRLMRSGSGQDALDAAIAEAHEEAIGDPDTTDDDDPSLELDQRMPFGNLTDLVYVWSLPCTFNPGGHGNRARTPVTLSIAGRDVPVHVFADDHDREAEKWTWAQVLRYLVAFHLLDEPGAEEWDAAGKLVADGDVLDRTEEIVGVNVAADNQSEEREDRPLYQAGLRDRGQFLTPVIAENAFYFTMMGEPRNLACSGLSQFEAFVLVAHGSGSHFRVATEPSTMSAAAPVDRLRWWSAGEGEVKSILRAATRAKNASPLAEITALTNVNQVHLDVDYSDVATQLLIVGDIWRYEITCELVPGWVADPNWDVAEAIEIDPVGDPSGFAAALAAAIADAEEFVLDNDAGPPQGEFYKRYHMQGTSHSEYTAAGRRWVLNETGRYLRESYFRKVAPFNKARYAPWEPNRPYGFTTGDVLLDTPLALLSLNADGDTVITDMAAGAWSRKGRPFLNCLSADSAGRSLGVYVEVSMDSGDHWQPMKEACRALGSEAGVHIDADDLAAIKSAEDEDVDFVTAYLNGTLRVRVTAVIEGDDRLMPDVPVDAFGSTVVGQRVKIVDVADRFHANDRAHTNTQFRADAGGDKAKPDEIKSTGVQLEEITSFAKTMMEIATGRQLACQAVIPWIELAGYEVGQTIDRITGWELELFQWVHDEQPRYVDIVGIEYSKGATTLILQDYKLKDALESAKPEIVEPWSDQA